MINNISEKTLKIISRFIEKNLGLNFTEERGNDVIRALANASKQKNIDLEEYINLILLNQLSNKDIINLATCLTIGETYFFRDKNLFRILRENLFPNMIRIKENFSRSMKIWSAGCSSGEEPYSIAILIKELIPDYKNWNIEIIATDINENFLNKARQGIYSEWSFRGTNLNFKNRYFKIIDDKHYKINDDVMELVKFYNLNLAKDTYLLDNKILNNIDIIFCRNVLMYFSESLANQIIKRFYNITVDGGWLIGAPTENLYFNNSSFTSKNIENTFLYNKNIKQSISLEYNSKNVSLETLYLKQYNNAKDNKYSLLLKLVENEMKKDYRNNDISLEPTAIISEIKSYKDNDMNAREVEDLCRSFANEGKLLEALEWCKKAIDKDKINPVYYQLLANIEQELGNFGEAVKALKKAVFLDSSFIMAYFNLGNLNLKQKKLKEAFKNFENVRALLENFEEKDIVPCSEEMTVGMLKQIIDNVSYSGGLYGES
ncbi:tetratricopeptide repeat protein [Clostridiaceae bacterium UIB06]|uniref:Tetratricopeptide repeat protein n=1 Tax=Clostridium thailandense TaxID=2794346 RepID=A0A949TGL4_9CLOT|nr:protein-glutamate O-methyltransferase CheR [Clostridium thailandense]MBV7272424.1 tetratricopeptide repeat protein [Clostridium thailandense]MCH5136948.1 tetratricopeptide repeat protein [Clostridiaceae bacterium UIB06]